MPTAGDEVMVRASLLRLRLVIAGASKTRPGVDEDVLRPRSDPGCFTLNTPRRSTGGTRGDARCGSASVQVRRARPWVGHIATKSRPGRGCPLRGRVRGRHGGTFRAVSTRRKDIVMSVAAQLALDDPDRGQLAEARAKWPVWCASDLCLRVVDDLLDLPEWLARADKGDVDGVLHTLARLASPTGGDDVVAVGALAWVLLPGARVVANRLRGVSTRIDELVATQLWLEVALVPVGASPQGRGQHRDERAPRGAAGPGDR